MKGQRILYAAANFLIRAMLAAIVFLVFLHSIYSTSFIGRSVHPDGTVYGKTFNIPDSPWRHVLLFVLATAVCITVRRVWHKLEVDRRLPGLVRQHAVEWLSILFIAVCTVWIAVTQLKPGSDPAKVYDVMMQWRAGDFSAFEKENYLFCYPFQSGIILFYYLLSFLFGEKSYIGLQAVNVVSLAAVYWLLASLARSFWKEDGRIPALVYLAQMLWVPLFFYITYIYGILPGMACSVGAIYLAVRYLERRKFRYMAGASLCIGLATVLKMNCLIYLVAIACFMVYDAVDTLLAGKRNRTPGRNWLASLGFVALMGIGVWGCNGLTGLAVERLSGYEMPEGEVMLSWVAMGLQEAPKGPGDYNGYIGEVFTDSNYDSQVATEMSLTEIRKILTGMIENPLDVGLPFFARKTAYQWNDPTFISMERMEGRKSAGKMPAVVRSIIDGRGSVILSVALNYVQTFLLAGVLLYLFLNRKSRSLTELMVAVVFLGGYLFHTFWEAGSSYTIPYFALIIPYAVKGFRDWVRLADDAVRERKIPFAFDRKTVLTVAGGALILTLFIVFRTTNLFDRTIALDDGADAVEQYYNRGDW